VTGLYELTFVFDGRLILVAHIEDNVGNPAAGGAVVFQYCSYKGLPTDDITQPDEAPSSACSDGSAIWRNLVRRQVDPTSGDALHDFGPILVVNTIGFRYRYIGQGSGIQNQLIEPVDWVR
jgi:hypothetical protein